MLQSILCGASLSKGSLSLPLQRGREAGLCEPSRGTTPISTVENFSITAAGSEKTLEGKRVSAVGR